MNSCSICNKMYHTEKLLQSNLDQYYCKECFKHQYCTGRQLTGRTLRFANRCEGDSCSKPRKMFPASVLSAIKQRRSFRDKHRTSKRPLQCPHADCHRYVSIFDLIAHFQHEHMDVRIEPSVLDSRNALLFYPKDVRYGMSQCLVLFNVMPEESGAKDEQKDAPDGIPITIALLASRLANAQLDNNSSDSLLDEDGRNTFVSDQTDKIIVWTASNIACNFSYTVAVSTLSEDIRVKYFGPVQPLGATSKDLCMEGHCLVLSHYHFAGMSENGAKPLQLDVIFHSED